MELILLHTHADKSPDGVGPSIGKREMSPYDIGFLVHFFVYVYSNN